MGEPISKFGWQHAPTRRGRMVSKNSIESARKEKDDNLAKLRKSREEATARKRDTDSGMTEMQRSVVKEKERRIKDLGHEEAYVVDDNGNVLYHGNGSKNRVAIPVSVQKDNIITHNHPRFSRNNNLSQNVGAALSGSDVYSAINSDAKGIRAVTSNYTFTIMRPKEGWGELRYKSASIERDLNNLYNKYLEQNLKRYSQLKPDSEYRGYYRKAGTKSGKIEYYYKSGDEQYTERAAVAANAQAMREVAKKYGLDYRRGRSS